MAAAQDSETIDTLNDLIETCLDGEYGFRASAEQVESSSLRANLLERAAECGTAAGQLRAHVVQLGGKPEERGSAIGAMHRGWVAVKTKLTSYDDLAVLEECERGEDAALSTYRDVLDTALPPPVRSLVEHQYAGVKRNHELVRRMRNAMRAIKEAAR